MFQFQFSQLMVCESAIAKPSENECAYRSISILCDFKHADFAYKTSVRTWEIRSQFLSGLSKSFRSLERLRHLAERLLLRIFPVHDCYSFHPLGRFRPSGILEHLCHTYMGSSKSRGWNHQRHDLVLLIAFTVSRD